MLGCGGERLGHKFLLGDRLSHHQALKTASLSDTHPSREDGGDFSYLDVDLRHAKSSPSFPVLESLHGCSACAEPSRDGPVASCLAPGSSRALTATHGVTRSAQHARSLGLLHQMVGAGRALPASIVVPLLPPSLHCRAPPHLPSFWRSPPLHLLLP